MELEQSIEKFRRQGLGLVAISYDHVEVLRHLSDRLGGFRFPLLADSDSKIIRDFGIFNHQVPIGHPLYGMCFPGTFIVDQDGVVRSKFFEQMHRQRFTAETILVKKFGAGGGKLRKVKTGHLSLSVAVSQDTLRPGNRFTFVVKIELPSKTHVYARGVKGYRPLSITVKNTPAILIHQTEFPEPTTLRLEAIKETVPVYQDRIRFYQDVTLSPKFPDNQIEIAATLSYQACDDKTCYAPVSVPLKFSLAVEQHDTKRVPKEIRRKTKR